MTELTENKIDWILSVEEWNQSGLTQPAFCEQKGIPYNQFVYQRTKLLKKNKVPPSMEFAALKIAPAVPVRKFPGEIRSSTITIEMADHIRLSLPCDPVMLSLVLKLLREKA